MGLRDIGMPELPLLCLTQGLKSTMINVCSFSRLRYAQPLLSGSLGARCH